MYAAVTIANDFGDDAKRLIMIKAYVLASLNIFYNACYMHVQKVLMLIARYFKRALCDPLLPPTTPSTTFNLSGFSENPDDPMVVYLNNMFTVPSSSAELPTVNVLGRLDHQALPLEFQVIGYSLDEQSMLNASISIKECAGFSARPDCWW